LANLFQNLKNFSSSTTDNFDTQELISVTASVIEFENHLVQASQQRDIERLAIEGIPIWHFLKTILTADLYKRLLRQRALKRRNMARYRISLAAQQLAVNVKSGLFRETELLSHGHSECLFLASLANNFEIDGRKIVPTVDFLRLLVRDLRGVDTDLFILHTDHKEVAAQNFFVPNVFGFSSGLGRSRWSKKKGDLDFGSTLKQIDGILSHYAKVLRIDRAEALVWIKAMIKQFLGVYDYAIKFLNMVNPAYLFVTEGGHLEPQAFACAAGALGIKVIEIQHGVLRPSQRAKLVGDGPKLDGLPDVFLSWQDNNIPGVKFIGPPVSHWLESGPQGLIEMGMEESRAFRIFKKEDNKCRPIENQKVLGIIYQDGMDLDWINTVVAHFGQLLKIEIRTRPDAAATPNQYANRHSKICRVTLSNKQSIWSFCIGKSLLVTDHSSAVVEADIMGIPIFTISPLANYLFSAHGQGNLWRAFSNSEELSRYLVTQPLPSHIGPRQHTSIDRVKTAIHEIFEDS